MTTPRSEFYFLMSVETLWQLSLNGSQQERNRAAAELALRNKAQRNAFQPIPPPPHVQGHTRPDA